MQEYYYIGLDVHKKVVAYCIKKADGEIVDEGTLDATRSKLKKWARGIGLSWIGAMEATLFTGWIYDFLKPYTAKLKVGHPLMLQAICASKKKSDRIDARKLADMIRCDWFPESYMKSGDATPISCFFSVCVPSNCDSHLFWKEILNLSTVRCPPVSCLFKADRPTVFEQVMLLVLFPQYLVDGFIGVGEEFQQLVVHFTQPVAQGAGKRMNDLIGGD